MMMMVIMIMLIYRSKTTIETLHLVGHPENKLYLAYKYIYLLLKYLKWQ